MAHDAADLGLEAHVEHTVRLVHHHIRHLVQPHLPTLEKVVQPAGRDDDNVRAAAELPELLALGRAAVEADGGDSDRPPELDRLRVDLRRKLSRRRHDECRRSAARVAPLALDPHEGGDEEAERLARAGLGNADDVATAHRRSPRRRLDRRRRREAGRGDLVHQTSGELSLLKGDEGLRAAGREVDLVLGHPLLRIRRRVAQLGRGEDLGRAVRAGAPTAPAVGRWAVAAVGGRGAAAVAVGGAREVPRGLIRLRVPVVRQPRRGVLGRLPWGRRLHVRGAALMR